jgi:eukaryotic-like serine/threonine-protein kinase
MKPLDETVEPKPAKSDISPDDPRVTRALEEYLALVEAGKKPDREAFLARDPEIAAALAECLGGLEFLRMNAPKLQTPVAEPPEPLARQALGDYHIVREVGRGGMGIVYEATQLSLGRRVALKVLPFAATLDAKQLQRFKNEAQAAANLHHPHIVPVYAFGCERGVHYYAMQFIEGQTLAGLIDGLRGEPAEHAADAETRSLHGPLASPNEKPTAPTVPMARATTVRTAVEPAHWRTAARFGAQAAEALEHAHQLGVIHRDVKPANLLIDMQRHLWVTDFGLARCVNDAGMTMTGDLLGTLRYMSPEQASARRGLVDHRTDVYSLGATLYELLTLRPVFDGAERAELLRQILHEDPVPPRRIRPEIPADLETIVLKALEKNVTERYATAQELADDLRRFIEDRPIQARRPGVVDRLGKWSRRHRSLVASAVALLLLAVVGLAVSTFLIGQEQARTRAAYEMEAQARAREADAREREAQSRGRAEDNFDQARRAVNSFAQIAIDMADDPKMRPLRRQLLEAALAYYKEFQKQQGDNPKMQEELAESHYKVATILSEMGRQEEVISQLDQARKIMNDLAVKFPTVPEYNAGVVIIDHDLGVVQEGIAIRLLKQKQVQEELRLTESQVKQINQLGDQRQNAYRNTTSNTANTAATATPEALRQKAEEVQAMEKALTNLLLAEQQRRFQQLLLQQRGTRALQESQVADVLKLTTEQLDRICAIQGETRRATGRNVAIGRADGKEIRDRVVNVLTPDQKAKWKQLTGEPFQGQLLPGGVFINNVQNGYGGAMSITNISVNPAPRAVPPGVPPVKKD